MSALPSIHLVRTEEYRLRFRTRQWIGAVGFDCYFFFSRLIAHSNWRISAFNWCLTTSNCGYCNDGNALVSLGHESLTWELGLRPLFVPSHPFPGRAFPRSPGLRGVLQWLRNVVWYLGRQQSFWRKRLTQVTIRGPRRTTHKGSSTCFMAVF